MSLVSPTAVSASRRMGDLACRRPGTRPGGRHVVDPVGGTIAEVPSAPQNARRRRQERRDSYLPGEPTLEREQPVSSCLCFR